MNSGATGDETVHGSAGDPEAQRNVGRGALRGMTTFHA